MLFKKSWWFLVGISFIFTISVQANPCICSQIPVFPGDFMSLAKQDKALIRDLKLINYPPLPWKIESYADENTPVFDVVIIGAGMAGLTAGAALFKEGIFNIQLFDQYAKGTEGPWINYARMKTLRSPKDLMGPALDIPHLTFHAWFEAQWGPEAWQQLGKIPNRLWMDYLNWYREALQLPVENNCRLVTLTPTQKGFEIEFEREGHSFFVKALKVVLATGRSGFGGPFIPDFVKSLPSSVYAHTKDTIHFENLKNRRVGVIGAGASAFDAAAVALESGAKSVDLIMRRARLPNINKFASLYYKSFSHGYYKLSNEQRWEFMSTLFDAGIPPPIDALKRLQDHQNFTLRSSTSIAELHFNDSQIKMETSKGVYTYDFIILGTGFYIDGYQQPELHAVIDQIALWQDHLPNEMTQTHPQLGRFPYLGPTFEFLPKKTGTASYLKDLYCFNYGATMSHGLLSSDIPAISIGAKRLAEGIAADFFIRESDKYLELLKLYQEEDFDQDHYFP